MVCNPYNLIVEGNVRNSTASGTVPLADAEITALYNGSTSTPAATVSGTPAVVELFVDFGESYDVCYLEYYTTTSGLVSLEVFHTDFGAVDSYAPVVASGTDLYRADIDAHVRTILIRHTSSGVASDINQLIVVGERNETLAFGSDPSNPLEDVYLPHATVNTASASANVIPIHNTNHFDEVARIAVVPTATEVDNYILIATSSSGTYYGINDYGIEQPAFKPIQFGDDQFNDPDNFPEGWERLRGGHRVEIYPNEGGLVVKGLYDAQIPGGVARDTHGIITKEPFSAQSFTAEIQIRFITPHALNSFDGFRRDIVFVLTEGYPILDIAHYATYLGDIRRGVATGGMRIPLEGVNVSASTAYMRGQFSVVEGPEGESLFSPNNSDNLVGNASFPHRYSTGDTSLDTFEDIINEGLTMANLTDAAFWHSWKITYDHQRQYLASWMDNIFMGGYHLGEEPFRENCYLSLVEWGVGGYNHQLRNFKIYKNEVFRQADAAQIENGGTLSATVSGTSDNLGKLIDGNDATYYVAPGPDGLTHVRVSFDTPKNVMYYTLRQKNRNEFFTAFGESYFSQPARTAVVNYGDKFSFINHLPDDGNDNRRAPTHSGIPLVASGVDFVDFQFVDYYDAVALPALALENLELYVEDPYEVDAIPTSTALQVPWSAGRWNNLRPIGSPESQVLALRDKVTPECLYWPWPEYLTTDVKYGFSTALNGRQFRSSLDYHRSQGLFGSTSSTGAGSYRQWHSEVQSQPEPFYIWRYFEEESDVTATYWNSSTLRPSNVANEFKFQYLKQEGNPSKESDWINIPPVTKPYTFDTHDAARIYRDYKQYLIDNNDGEYYTNYFDIPDMEHGVENGFGVGGNFSLAGEVYTPNVPNWGVFSHHQATATGPSNGLRGFIEFDEVIRTRGIRFVVKNPTIESGRESGVGNSSPSGEPRYDFALEQWRVMRNHGAGSYTSPVFDTGTEQNTERLVINTQTTSGTGVAIFARSSPLPPESAHHPTFEAWHLYGAGGNLDVDFPNQGAGSNVDAHATAIPLGELTYYLTEEFGYVYNHRLDLWQYMPSYPTNTDTPSTGGDFDNEDLGLGPLNNAPPDVRPDNRVINRAVYFDNTIWVAAYDTGATRIPRMIKFEFEGNLANTWQKIPTSRPPTTDYSSMAADVERRRLYFFNRSGVVSYYDIDLSNWVQIEVDFPLHGGTTRDEVALTQVGRRVYLFGGNNSASWDITTFFDLDTHLFSSGASLPKPATGSSAVYVPGPEVIYLFAVSNLVAFNSLPPVMKYFIETDSWDVVETAHWIRTVSIASIGNNAALYYYRKEDGYIHVLGDGNGALYRILVEPQVWESGQLPYHKDPVWGEQTQIVTSPWRRLDGFGELMPQNRYFQFKVEFYTYDQTTSPALESVRIVVPQEIEVPASGTANAYVKIDVSSDERFYAWYTGRHGGGNNLAVLYTESDEGLVWQNPTVVSGALGSDTGTQDTIDSPWLIKEPDDSYKIWFSRGRENFTSGGQFADDHDIWYNTTSDPTNFSEDLAQEVITRGGFPETGESVWWPCVVKVDTDDYRMWYSGKDSEEGSNRIYYATSTSGIVWDNHQLVIDIGEDTALGYDAFSAYRASVLYEDNKFRIWYTGADIDGVERILHRESDDGISWTFPQLTLDVGAEGVSDVEGAARPRVLRDESIYYMYYMGLYNSEYMAIRAESADGLQWANFEPVIAPRGMHYEWDSNGTQDIFVILERESIVPRQLITEGKIKIHNDKASL